MTKTAEAKPALPVPQTRLVEREVRLFRFEQPRANEGVWVDPNAPEPTEVERLRAELATATGRIVYLESVFRDLLATVHAMGKSGRAAQVRAHLYDPANERYGSRESDRVELYWVERVPMQPAT